MRGKWERSKTNKWRGEKSREEKRTRPIKESEGKQEKSERRDKLLPRLGEEEEEEEAQHQPWAVGRADYSFPLTIYCVHLSTITIIHYSLLYQHHQYHCLLDLRFYNGHSSHPPIPTTLIAGHRSPVAAGSAARTGPLIRCASDVASGRFHGPPAPSLFDGGITKCRREEGREGLSRDIV